MMRGEIILAWRDFSAHFNETRIFGQRVGEMVEQTLHSHFHTVEKSIFVWFWTDIGCPFMF
jgi:hypothetical protein